MEDKGKFWNIANIISLSRVFLIFIFILLIYFGTIEMKIISIFLCPLIFLTDYIDGYLARKYKVSTDLGSFLDLVGDRVTEMVLWIFFLGVNLVPVWAPIIIISRGFLTDYIRAKALKNGKTVYGMVDSRIGKIFVSSRIARGISGLSKVSLFTLLSIQFTFPLLNLGKIIFWLVVFVVSFNLIRGFPVFYDGVKYFD